MTDTNEMIQAIEDILKTVYDPEFPIIDIFTLGLIYDIKIEENNLSLVIATTSMSGGKQSGDNSKTIKILMTFTTPACPMAEMLQEMIKNAIKDKYPDYQISLEVTFDPMRNMDMIKDPDLKRMFE